MKMASASPLQASCSFSARAVTGRGFSASLAFIGNPARNVCFFSHKFKGCPNLVNPVRPRYSSLAAVVGDKTAAPNDCSGENLSSSDSPDPAPSDDKQKRNSEKVEKKDADDHNMFRVCDKLIEVFLVDKPTPADWSKLLAYSREWSNIRPHFFKRCQDRADSESDPGMKHKLFRLGRKLKEVDEDVQRHNELLEVIRGSPSEISEIVARRRKDFTEEFFVHLHTVVESYYDNPTEQNALVELGNACIATVQAYDTATESMDAIKAAELKLEDIVNSPSLDVACRKIDNLAAKNQLDSALMLMITKAWSAAKDSILTKDEVKDMLFHMYMTSRKNLEKQVPKETRIMKHLLAIEDPEERLSNLNDAFTPPVLQKGEDVDDLYTTPEKLHARITAIVDAYNFSMEGTLLGDARDLMNPEIIVKLEELKKLIEKHFM